MLRYDGREAHELRPVRIITDYLKYPEGSALIELGDTRVICTASLEEKVPAFLKDTGKGWISAEYAMLPRATETRTVREVTKGRLSGRTQEIQRLIGRSLRGVVNLEALGERTIWLDCDVIQADGGTRTAAITGSFVALVRALTTLKERLEIEAQLVKDFVAAVSVGIVGDELLLDLNYLEDSTAVIDMNVVMTGSGRFIEIQGTAEQDAFDREEMLALLELAESGIRRLIAVQQEVLGLEALP